MYSSENEITQNINQLQSDILLEDTSRNPLFTASAISSRNKALKTNSKKIVNAINEITENKKVLENTLRNGLNAQYNVLGDVVTDVELVAKLKNIAPNIILALELIKAEVDQISILAQDDYEDRFMVGDTPQTEFRLTHIPVGKLRLYINGTHYSKELFSYNKDIDPYLVTWTFTEANGGFDISDCEVIFEYDWNPNSPEEQEIEQEENQEP